jgi:hypothetical protein
MPATTKRTERNKKAVPGSLILARLRIGEIYSLWLYRISSFVSFIIPHEVESFNSKSFLAFFGECKTAAVLNAVQKPYCNSQPISSRPDSCSTNSGGNALTPARLPGLRQARSLKDHQMSKSIADSIFVNAKRGL